MKPDNKMAEFTCPNPECRSPVRFDPDKVEVGFSVSCPACGREKRFDRNLAEKFRLLRELVSAIRQAKSILGRGNVVVEFRGGKLEMPFNLFLHRLTTELALDFREEELDLRIAVNPFLTENNDSTGGQKE